MRELRVGDYIECTVPYIKLGLLVGMRRTVAKVSVYDKTMQTATEGDEWINCNRFKLVNEEEQMDNWDDYTFNIRSTNQVLDYDIEADLSIQNPMMIAEFEDAMGQRCETCGGKGTVKEPEDTEHTWNDGTKTVTVTPCSDCEGTGRASDMIKVYLHDSIWNKARNSGPLLEDDGWFDTEYEKKLSDCINDTSSDGEWSLISKGTTLNKLIRLVKEIRNSEWNDKRNTKVTVRKISL